MHSGSSQCHIYACGPDGRYICAKLDTGEQVWSTFSPSTGGRPSSWANVFTVRNGDLYYLANDLGELVIALMSPSGYEELGRAHLIAPTHKVGSRTLVLVPSCVCQPQHLPTQRQGDPQLFATKTVASGRRITSRKYSSRSA